jgi:hypothetical protein
MKRHHSLWIVLASVVACAAEPDAERELDDPSLREGSTIDLSAPAANAPVVATLLPGAPFAFGDRYAFVKAPGVGPNMSRFTPANVGTIPRLVSGDIVAIQRNGQVSRARLVGFDDEGEVVFRPQAGSPFVHAFSAIPWSAWGAAANAVHGCATAVHDEWSDCVETVGEGSWCIASGDDELDDCASGQDYAVTPSFGGTLHFDFDCLLIAPHSIAIIGAQMTLGNCEGAFWGTMTQEPGFLGCEDVYNGTWLPDEDCGHGVFDGGFGAIIFDDVKG